MASKESLREPPSRESSPLRKQPFLRYSTMATQMGITIFLGVWGGKKLDQYFGSKFPIWTVVLSLAAVMLAIYQVIRELLKK